MGELTFIRPTGGYISSVFDEPRKKKNNKTGEIIHYTHKGIDYAAAKGTPVEASESGEIIAVDTDIPGYGNLIIIDHAPDAKDNERHIYTLYAHLDGMHVKTGDYVEKGETIGAVGHTGYAYSRSGKDPSHLHFEVIDCSSKASRMDILSKEGSAREYRKDPKKYLNERTAIEGTLPDMVERAIMDRIEFVPDIGLKRGDPFRLEAWLDEKNIGYLNKDNGTLKVNLKYDLKEELRKMWRKPLRVPMSEPVRLEYEIKIR